MPAPPLETALLALARRHGPTAVVRGSTLLRPPCATRSTGIPTLDAALPGNGVPLSALTHLVGPPGSGVTTLTLSILAQAQQAGGWVAWFGSPATFPAAAAQRMGLVLERVLLLHPKPGADVALLLRALLQRRAVAAISLPITMAPPLDAPLRQALATSGTALLIPQMLPLNQPATPTPLRGAVVQLRLQHAGWHMDGARRMGLITSVTITTPLSPTVQATRALTLPLACPEVIP